MSGRRGGRVLRWTIRHAIGAAADAGALLVADALLTTVSVTASALVLALAALQAPFFVLGPPLRWFGPRALASMPDQQPSLLGCLYVVLMATTFSMLFARVALVALVVPGFDIDGLLSYTVTTALTLVYPGVALVVRRLRRRDPPT